MKPYLKQFAEWAISLPSNLIEHARVRLTLIYTGIMMLVVIGFSFALYNAISLNVKNALHDPQNNFGIVLTPQMEEQFYSNIMKNFIGRIEFIDLMVMIVIAIANYFFVGEVLKPIEQSMDRQRRFSSDASHDMRTPLAIMKTEIEVALANPKSERQDFEQILRSNLEEITTLTTLISDLLLLSRIDNKKIKIEDTAIKSDELLEKIIHEYSLLADKKNIKISSKLAPLYVRINEGLFRRAVGNIISNAIYYNKENGKIDITLSRLGLFAEFKIRDNGVGIPKNDLPKVFDRFYKVSSSRKDTLGSGIGLSIAKEIIEYYNGKIEIESEVDVGTQVTIKIPLG